MTVAVRRDELEALIGDEWRADIDRDDFMPLTDRVGWIIDRLLANPDVVLRALGGEWSGTYGYMSLKNGYRGIADGWIVPKQGAE